MIKKIDIAGIQLDNYSARECVMAVERMLNENAFHTVEEVNMDMNQFSLFLVIKDNIAFFPNLC